MSEHDTPSKETLDQIADLKSGYVKLEGAPVEESPEEEAAMTLAFTCALGNEKAREIVAMIKAGNIPHMLFCDRNSDFEYWWFNEGSGMTPKNGEDTEVHVERISKIAWSNGEYVQKYKESK